MIILGDGHLTAVDCHFWNPTNTEYLSPTFSPLTFISFISFSFFNSNSGYSIKIFILNQLRHPTFTLLTFCYGYRTTSLFATCWPTYTSWIALLYTLGYSAVFCSFLHDFMNVGDWTQLDRPRSPYQSFLALPPSALIFNRSSDSIFDVNSADTYRIICIPLRFLPCFISVDEAYSTCAPWTIAWIIFFLLFSCSSMIFLQARWWMKCLC